MGIEPSMIPDDRRHLISEPLLFEVTDSCHDIGPVITCSAVERAREIYRRSSVSEDMKGGKGHRVGTDGERQSRWVPSYSSDCCRLGPSQRRRRSVPKRLHRSRMGHHKATRTRLSRPQNRWTATAIVRPIRQPKTRRLHNRPRRTTRPDRRRPSRQRRTRR